MTAYLRRILHRLTAPLPPDAMDTAHRALERPMGKLPHDARRVAR